MPTLQASEFKTHCLRILDEVARTGEAVTITKRGRVVARLIPAVAEDEDPLFTLRGSVELADDCIEPALAAGDLVLEAEPPA